MHVVSHLWTPSHLCVTAWTHGVTKQCVMLLLVMGCWLQVGSSHAHHYPYWRAALLPFTTPLFVLAVVGIKVPPVLGIVHAQLLLAWAAGGIATALALRRVYPRDGFPYGRLLGACQSGSCSVEDARDGCGNDTLPWLVCMYMCVASQIRAAALLAHPVSSRPCQPRFRADSLYVRSP